MIEFLKKDRWSSYIVGASIGILAWFVFLTAHTIGTTVSFQKLSGILAAFFNQKAVVNSKYFMQYFEKPLIGWNQMFVIFIFFGSLVASKLSKSKRVEYVPVIWEKNYGSSKLKRNVFAFIGGIILLFGARLAQGCTSGHAISGGLQLSINSWIFMMFVFASAIPTALIMYKKS